ncbi:hypothetical protein ACFIOZ_12190 [Vreelandella sp. F11]|uniref:hypothetical protein n=1 Tax=Vreelandella sp. F11 TaxID=3394751 RepID=UPI0036DA2E5D
MKKMQHKRSFFIGFFLAVIFFMLGLMIQNNQFFLWTDDFQLVLIVLAFFLPGVVFLALPFVLLLRTCGLLSWFSALLAFIAAGILYYQFIAYFLGGSGVEQVFAGAMFGVQAGIGFCLGVWPNHLFKPIRFSSDN